MTWGPYWMFYQCESCNKKYRYSLEDLECKSFGACPNCGLQGKLVAESKDNPESPEFYDIVSAD